MRLFILIFSGLSSLAFSQPDSTRFEKWDPTPENFQKAMAITNPAKSGEINKVTHLSIEYSYVNEDTCIILGEHAVEISRKFPNQHSLGTALLELGDSYRIFGKMAEGEKLINEGKTVFENLGEDAQVAYANNKLGALNQDKGDLEAAAAYYLEALETWENLKDSQNIYKPNQNLSWVFYLLESMDKALEYNGNALEIAEKMDHDRDKLYARSNRAVFFNHIAENLARNLNRNAGDSGIIRDSMNVLQKRAAFNFEESLRLARKLNDKQSILRTLINMSDLYNQQGKYRESLSMLMEAETLLDEVGSITLEITNQTYLAETHRYLKNYQKAYFYAKKAINLAEAHQMESKKYSANVALFNAYRDASRYKEAITVMTEINAYLNQAKDEGIDEAIADAEARFQNAQKEKIILEQKNELLQLEKDKIKAESQRNRMIGGGIILAILGIFGFQFNRIRKERNDKIAFTEALIFAQENERKRIARELHDGVGQSLLLLKKQMEYSVENTLENQEMIAETLEEVRAISRDLHPFQLEKLGLTAAILEIIQKVDQASEIFLSKEVDNIDNEIPKEAQIHIFRTIQEALNNIVKHSQATAAKVVVQNNEKELFIQIMDNGKGFDYELAIVKQKSLGLKTMFERMAAIGGKLVIKPGEQKGTIVEVRVKKQSQHAD